MLASLVERRAARKRHERLRSFQGPTAHRDAFRVGQFIRATVYDSPDAVEWCRDQGVVTRASSEGINAAGGVLVPEEMMNAIIVLREVYGVFRREATVVQMKADTFDWPRRTGGLTAYFPGENAVPTGSNSTFDDVSLTPKKLAVLTRMSSEITEDAVIELADYLANEIAYAFSSKEDDCGFNGDGTSTYGGIRGLTTLAIDGNHNAGKFVAAAGHNTFATLDAIDITGLMGLLPQYALPNAKFYCSEMAYAICFARLLATAGGNSTLTLKGTPGLNYLGFPISIAQKLPAITTTLSGKAMLFFGDLQKAAALGDRRGVAIRPLNERYADNDQIGVMGTERFDINCHDVGDNTTAGPIVALVAP
jgi:HK97 family phage major capsid protein